MRPKITSLSWNSGTLKINGKNATPEQREGLIKCYNTHNQLLQIMTGLLGIIQETDLTLSQERELELIANKLKGIK